MKIILAMLTLAFATQTSAAPCKPCPDGDYPVGAFCHCLKTKN